MSDLPQNPLAGDPPTVKGKDKGGFLCFAIRPRELTPVGVIATDKSVLVLSVFMTAWLVLGLLAMTHTDLANWAVAGVELVVARFVCRNIFLAAFKVSTSIVMTKDRIRVSRGVWSKSFDRNREHRFAIVIHDKAAREHQDNDFAIRKAGSNGKVIRKTAYYGESFHVVMIYEGHRIDLLTVFGQRRAEAVMARLQHCDKCLYEAAKSFGSGPNPHVDKDWSDTPGGLDHE